MVFLPECFDYVGRTREETVQLATECANLLQHFTDLARKYNVWLSLGGYHELRPVKEGDSTDKSQRVFNAHVIVNSDGEVIARYDKTHLFDIDLVGSVSLKESDFTIHGRSLSSPVETPVGKIGLSTCYDLRFPELSCLLRQKGAEILTYPSAFTVATGLAHWEPLLRARAIETQCYVVAAAQVGKHNEKRMTYGHSIVVDPWGCVIAQCSEGVGLAFARIDIPYLKQVRQQLPCSQHRRTDLYSLVGLKWGNKACVVENRDFAFGTVQIPSDQVFLQSQHCYAFVNRKPVVPGHVLVATLRSVRKLTELETEEIFDVFSTVQRIQAMLERHYGVSSATVAIQDGPEAGQTVRVSESVGMHFHTHILPRKADDFDNNDDIYSHLAHHDRIQPEEEAEVKFRNPQDMVEEAALYRKLLETYA